MEKFFLNLTNVTEIKNRYKELAKIYHPDMGGDVETMKELNNQFEQVLKGAYQKEGKSVESIFEELKINEKMMAAMYEVLSLEGIEVEICGNWLWITGNTKIHKEKFKASGFRWSAHKGCWYWRDEKFKSYNRRAKTLDEIRYSWGSMSVQRAERAKIA